MELRRATHVLKWANVGKTGQMVQTLPPAVMPDDPTRARRGDIATVIDGVSIILAVALTTMIALDIDINVRPATALLFAVFVPGWTVLRVFDVPVSMMSIAGSVAISASAMMLIGEGTVLAGGWHWYPVGVLLAGGCATLGFWSMSRRRQLIVPALAREAAPVVPGWVGLTCAATAIAGWWFVVNGLDHGNLAKVDALGLLPALPALYWIGTIVIVGGLVTGCLFSSRAAWLNVAALLAALHGLPGILEPHPRFSVAWVHVGFADHIADHGTLLTRLDARFSWAGFFSGGGLLQRFSGTDSLLWMVRYAPLFYNAVAVMLIVLLARRTRATGVQAIVAATLFCVFNWIGQDYFSPQATAFVLYLSIVTLVLYAFPANPAMVASTRLRRLLRAEADGYQGLLGPAPSTGISVLVLGACYLMLAALVISHQLTPVFLMSAALLLVIGNVTRLRTLPFAAAVMFLAWLSFGASAYWLGHLSELTGSVGHVGKLLNQNVSSRTKSTSLGRRFVVTSRLGLALAAWSLAGLSLVRLWRQRRTPVALLCLFLAPFPMLFLQPYGGEMALRVCYFTLPAASILIARMVAPIGRRTIVRMVAFGAIVAALIPVFLAARFGNEKFEMFSDADVGIMNELYSIAPQQSVVYVASLQTLQYSDRVEDVRFRNLPSGTAAAVTKRFERLPDATTVFVLFSETQAAYGTVALGRPDGWLETLTSEFVATGRYRVVAQLGAAVLLELER
jgi:hypothetical protein